MDMQSAKAAVCFGGKELLRTGLTAATWGNVSCRIDENTMAITPSGIPYEKLEEADIAIVRLSDLAVQSAVQQCADMEGHATGGGAFGNIKPSSESPMHAAIYQKRPEVNAVIHFHSVYASAASVMGEEVPPYLEDMAQIVGASLRISEHALTGSAELTENVLAALEDRFGALLANHGAVCLGRDMEEALAAALIVEKACHVYLLAKLTGSGKALSSKQAEEMRDFYLNRYQRKE